MTNNGPPPVKETILPSVWSYNEYGICWKTEQSEWSVDKIDAWEGKVNYLSLF